MDSVLHWLRLLGDLRSAARLQAAVAFAAGWLEEPACGHEEDRVQSWQTQNDTGPVRLVIAPAVADSHWRGSFIKSSNAEEGQDGALLAPMTEPGTVQGLYQKGMTLHPEPEYPATGLAQFPRPREHAPLRWGPAVAAIAAVDLPILQHRRCEVTRNSANSVRGRYRGGTGLSESSQ